MKITPKWNFVEGSFDTKKTEMVCVPHKKYGEVTLAVKANGDKGMSVTFAKIKLHSRDLAVDADAVFKDAVRFGEEIARRWNEFENKK
jgi:hypothetical protein